MPVVFMCHGVVDAPLLPVTLASDLPTISQWPYPLRPIAVLVFIARCAGFFHPARRLSANPNLSSRSMAPRECGPGLSPRRRGDLNH
jgi:hypothetical protein